jgi:TolA-binding protein
VLAAEQSFVDLQWQRFEVATARASDGERRSYRSLLFNLTTQRQLLRQVERQEALRQRMQRVEQQVEALAEEMGAGASSSSGSSRGSTASSSRDSSSIATSSRGSERGAQQAPAMASAAAAAAASAAAAAASVAAAPGQRLVAAGISLPHAAKAATGGEDAFFVSACGRGAVGVADGVGGWAAQGVDPSLYPRRFVAACEEVLQEQEEQQQLEQRQAELGGSSSSTDHGDAAEAAAAAAEEAAGVVLADAHERTSEPGSATIILAVQLPGGRLSVANLGDCGLRVVRSGRIHYASQVRSKGWLF